MSDDNKNEAVPPFASVPGYPRREHTSVWDGMGTENIGQKVGMPKGCKLYDPDLNATVIVCRFRSAYKNQEMANTLLDLLAMEPRWTGDKGDNRCIPTPESDSNGGSTKTDSGGGR